MAKNPLPSRVTANIIFLVIQIKVLCLLQCSVIFVVVVVVVVVGGGTIYGGGLYT